MSDSNDQFCLWDETDVMKLNFRRMIQMSHQVLKCVHPLLGVHTAQAVQLCEAVKKYFDPVDYEVLECCAWLMNIGYIGFDRGVGEAAF